jgi:hypothetical protein
MGEVCLLRLPRCPGLANQFKWFSEGTEMFATEFSIEQTRSVDSALLDFASWLNANRNLIPSH